MTDFGDSSNRLSDDWFLDNLERTIRFAEIRCVPRETILRQVLDPDEWGKQGVDALLYRAGELQLTDAELARLVDGMTHLAWKTEDASPEIKHTTEVVILRLMRLLPARLAARFASPYLDHKRKGRRRWAYATLGNKPLTRAQSNRLANVFKRTGDKTILGTITRTPQCVQMIGANYLLDKLSAKKDRHWRGRVLQCLLTYDRGFAISLANRYPWEFVYAIGRTEDSSLAPNLADSLKNGPTNQEFLSIYAWALGKVGARSDLQKFKGFVSRLRHLRSVD
jgi:hypothetical protein